MVASRGPFSTVKRLDAHQAADPARRNEAEFRSRRYNGGVDSSVSASAPRVGDLDPRLVDALRSAVLQRLTPLLVVLFGSQAKGTSNPDSDIDLLVIDDQPFSPRRSRRRIIGDIRRSIRADSYPVDVLLFDAAELARWRETTNHVIARALREGVVLYERPGAR